MRKSGLTGDEAYALSKRRGTSGDLGPLKKELGVLKEDLDELESLNDFAEIDTQITFNGSPWVNGAIYSETYQDFTSKARAISNYIHFDNDASQHIVIKSEYRAYLVTYEKICGTYTFVNNKLLISTGVDHPMDIDYDSRYYYRFQLGHRDTSVDMDLSDVPNACEFGEVSTTISKMLSFSNSIKEIGLSFSNFIKKPARTPLVTWIDDDTVRSSTKGITFVKQLADELGIKCVFACITNTISGDDNYSVATKNLLLDYQKEGFQIVSHSNTHDGTWKPSSADYSVNHIEEEVTESLKILKEKGFIECDYLVTPYGVQNDDAQRVALKWCKCLVNAGGSSLYNHLYENGKYRINRVFIDINLHDLDYYKNIIDTALANGDWIVFGTHSGMTVEGGGWDYDLVKNVMQYALDKGIRIATLSEALKIRKPIYDLYDMFN